MHGVSKLRITWTQAEGKVTDLLADAVEDLDEAALLRLSKMEALSRSFPNDRLFARQLLRKLPS